MTTQPDSAPCVLGVDVGGTKTHVAAFDADLNPIVHDRVRTQTGGASIVSESVLSTISALIDRLDGHHVTSIGIGIPGLIDQAVGTVQQAVNLGVGSEPVNLIKLVKDEFDLPCVIDNDVNVAALGAHHVLAASRSVSDLAYLSVGTGMAAGIILDGNLHRGHRGVAGEIGHFPIDPLGPRCECGLHGCIEAIASGSAIARAWPSNNAIDAGASLLAAVEAGDPKAIAALTPVADALARAVYMLAVSFDVDLIVIGGGVADLGAPLLKHIAAGIARIEADSGFVAALDLTARMVLKPAHALGATGAAVLARSSELQ